jgi:uncharacterized membrane protein YagU involved in acid resistance
MNTSKTTPPIQRARAFEAILFGGLVAGFLDGLDAVVFYRWAFDVAPAELFQSIASGILGVRSFNGGWQTVALGVALQLTIALGAAAVFYAASRVIPALYRWPFVFGPAFGLAVYFVMHYIVVPLSAVPRRTVPVTTVELLDLLFAHLFLVGLPIALFARRSVRLP